MGKIILRHQSRVVIILIVLLLLASCQAQEIDLATPVPVLPVAVAPTAVLPAPAVIVITETVPTATPQLELMETSEIAEEERPLAALPALSTDEITIATFNVKNLFDTQDPHPADLPKPTQDSYETKLNRTADIILAMGTPTIIGLQEVENLGILKDLVALAQLSDYQYQPILIEGTNERGLDIAFLVRGDQAVIDGVTANPAADGSTIRPPLVLTTTVNLASGTETLYVLNNQFTSLEAGEDAAESRRTAQAVWDVRLIQQIQATNPDAQIVILGDFNSLYHTPPLDTLQSAGLVHAFDIFGEEDVAPSTVILESKAQSLDHILMTQNLFDRLGSVDVLPIYADNPLPSPNDDSLQPISAHLPLVVRFSFSH